MKRKAIVKDINDPDGLGRIRVDILGFDELGRTTPWCYPCSPLAGSGYGMFFLPQVGDEVYVEEDADGDWVYAGYFWTSRHPKPSGAGANNRIIATPAGHRVSLDDSGDITVTGKGGGSVTIKANGNVEIVGGEISLNGTDGKVVTTEHICAYTGYKHPQGSGTVKADK